MFVSWRIAKIPRSFPYAPSHISILILKDRHKGLRNLKMRHFWIVEFYLIDLFFKKPKTKKIPQKYSFEIFGGWRLKVSFLHASTHDQILKIVE